MRRAYLVAGIGTLVLVASCSGKPNDLRHYATQEPVATTTVPVVAAITAATTTSATPTTAALAEQVTSAVMTDASVSDIGFHPSQPRQTTVVDTLSACGAPLNEPKAPATAAQAGWIGASSVTTLTDYVAVYQGTTAAQVLAAAKRALTCGVVVQYTVAPPAGLDADYSWCEKVGSCTLLLARGDLLATVRVVTTSEPKAENLIKQVAVPAAAKLATAD